MSNPTVEMSVARPTTGTGRRRAAVAATFATALCVLLVSALLLTWMGVPYGSPGGSALAKVHPATWLSLITVLVWGWASGGLGRILGEEATRRPGVVVFGFGIVLLLFQCAVVVKLPLTPALDTFLLPLALFVALVRLDERERAAMETLIHVVVAANSLLALFEYGTGHRLTPMYEADGRLITYEWRATAFFGHPLINAFVTGDYVVALAFGASPRLSPLARFVAIGLSTLAMIAFGGRVAMILALAMLALAGAIGVGRLLVGGRFSVDRAVPLTIAATLAVIGFVVFVDGGGADRFVARFQEDHGSAQTRLSMLRIFSDLSVDQFLLWPDPQLVWQAQREHAIRLGIESSEVGFVANYGLLVSIAFFASLAAFMREVVRATSRNALWTLAYFVAVMSTSLGVAAKTSVLAMYVLLASILTPRAASEPR